MMIRFGAVVDAIRKLADKHPGHVSPASLFDRDGVTPLCIVGQALVSELGLHLKMEGASWDGDLMLDGRVVGHSSDSVQEMSWRQLGIKAPTLNQLNWVQEVQEFQDNYGPWGDAVANADVAMSRVKKAAVA